MTLKHNLSLWILILSSLLLLHSHCAPYDVTSLVASNTAGFQIKYYASNGGLGTRVINAGDVNKDGINDIVMGAPTASSLKGEIHVRYGVAGSSFSDITLTSTSTQSAGFKVTGNAVGDYFGASLSAGDVNKDNYADIIVGAPNKNSNRGAVYIVNGDVYYAHLDLDLSTDLQPTTTGCKIVGAASGDSFGYSVASADVNGDGYADLIVGAPYKSSNTGTVYVIFGRAKTSWPTTMDLSSTTLNPTSTGFTITGSTAGDQMGYSVASADVNGDVYADIIIGAPGKNGATGAAYIIYGKASFTSANLDPTTLNPATTGFMISGRSSGDLFGSACGSAGDMDNDGKNEIFVASTVASSNEGVVYVIYGQSGPLSSNIDLSSTSLVPTSTGFTITGDAAGTGFGFSVAPAGDENSDGFADIIIGAPSSNKIFVIYGSARSARQDVILASITLDPLVNGFAIAGSSGSTFGTSVSVAGGFTLNSKNGLLIGAPQVSSLGYAYIIFPSKMCASGCVSCTQLTSCTQCDPAAGYGLENSVCVLCPSGKYSTGTSACTNDCPAGCNQCYLNSGTPTCTTCLSGYFKSGITCQACMTGCNTCSSASVCTACSPSQYHLISGICCPLLCSACSSATVCTSCTSGVSPVANQCLGCSPGTYLSGSTCASCDPSCTTCSTGTTCDSCPSTKFFVTSASSCVDACPDGTYEAGANCEDCSNLCENCQGTDSTCTSCPGGTYLDTNLATCGSTCPDGTYPSSLSGNCESCDDSCETCAGEGPSNCESCPSGTYLDLSQSTCGITCPPGTSASPTSGECEGCYGGLLQVVSTAECVSTCPGSTYLVGIYCQDCSNLCENCQGTDSTCTSCPSGTYLDTNLATCGSTCPSGTFPSSGTGHCETCSSAMNSCTLCLSSSVCTGCGAGSFLYNSQCLSTCIDGTYPVGSTCQDCSSLCGNCQGTALTCTRCPSGTYLDTNLATCGSTCPDESYPSSGSGRCESCPGTCRKCTNPLLCTACEPEYALIQSQCVTCPQGTYVENEQCEDCVVGCAKCENNSACEVCREGYTLSSSHLCVQEQKKEPENGREKAAGDTFEGSSIAGAALASGSSLPINFGLVAKIIRNLKYLNVTVSPELQTTFYSWKVSSGFLRAPKSWSLESQSKPLPIVFSRYGLDPVFLINYWKPFVLTMIGFVLFLLFKVMEVTLYKGRGSTQQDPLKSSIPRKLNLAASNFALTQVYSNLDDVIFYFVLDARSTSVDGAFRGFSLILALVLILAGSIILGFHGFLLQKYQRIKKENSQTDSLKKFLYKYENVKLIFQDFKDTNLTTQSFLWIHLMRAVVSSLISSTLFEHPLVQIVLLLALNIGMIVFIAVKSPFKEILSTCSQLFCEIILLLANICMLTMALFDHAESYPVNAIKSLSTSVIVLNAILLFGSAILMIIAILKDLYVSYQAQKKPQQQQGIPLSLKINRVITTNGEKLNSNFTASNQLQQGYTQSYVDGENTGVLDDLNGTINAPNQLGISDLTYDVKTDGGHGNNYNSQIFPGNVYQAKYQENNFDANTIDETMINTSNVDLLQSYSPMRGASVSRPKVRGKIKMPGGVVWNPRSNNNGLASPAFEFHQSSHSNKYNDSIPTNMANLRGSGSQSKYPNQAENIASYEEFVLERTRERAKYHDA